MVDIGPSLLAPQMNSYLPAATLAMMSASGILATSITAARTVGMGHVGSASRFRHQAKSPQSCHSVASAAPGRTSPEKDTAGHNPNVREEGRSCLWKHLLSLGLVTFVQLLR